MQKKTKFFISAGIFLILAMAVLWLTYFSDRTRPDSEPPRTAETHPIDFSARLDPSPTQEPEPGDPEERVREEPEHADFEDPEQEYEDPLVRDGFINVLAEMIFEKYLPPSAPGQPSRLMLTFKMVNMRFGADLGEFNVQQQDVLKAREEVMQHLLQPVVVEMASSYLGPRLVERIVYLAQTREKTIPGRDGSETRLLTRAETADMLRVLARRLSYLAQVFERSVRDDGVLDLVEEYLQTVDELRDVYFEYWQLEDGAQDQDRERLGGRIKELITKREAVREGIVSRIASPDMREAGYDHVYEAQWVFRRVRVDGFSRDSILALAAAGRSLSVKILERAEEVLTSD